MATRKTDQRTRDLTTGAKLCKTGLVGGILASEAANIAAAEPTPGGWLIAMIAPAALLLCTEVLIRVPGRRDATSIISTGVTIAIAGIAAWVSYWHMAEVAARFGESATAAHLIPFLVDGAILVTTLKLRQAHDMIAHPTARRNRRRKAQPTVHAPARKLAVV